jgi:hypothetical protein
MQEIAIFQKFLFKQLFGQKFENVCRKIKIFSAKIVFYEKLIVFYLK